MAGLQAAAQTCGTFSIRGIDLGFEFLQKALAFFFQRGIIRRGNNRLCRTGGGMRNQREREHTFFSLTHRTRRKISGVIGLALYARQSVADTPGAEFRRGRKAFLLRRDESQCHWE